MIRKLFMVLFIFLLCAGNAGLSQMGKSAMKFLSSWDSRFTNSFSKTWPLTDAEEQPAKGTPGEEEGKEDHVYFAFKWSSLNLSWKADLSGTEADVLFKSIDLEVSVPPPKS